MRFNWYFEPDAQDVARNNGYNLGLIGDAACKTAKHPRRSLRPVGAESAVRAVF